MPASKAYAHLPSFVKKRLGQQLVALAIACQSRSLFLIGCSLILESPLDLSWKGFWIGEGEFEGACGMAVTEFSVARAVFSSLEVLDL